MAGLGVEGVVAEIIVVVVVVVVVAVVVDVVVVVVVVVLDKVDLLVGAILSEINLKLVYEMII